MASLTKRLKGIFAEDNHSPERADETAPHPHVVAPDSVTLPFPRGPREEINIPASINGRDLSAGRL